MGSVAEKINFTRIAVDNIEQALARKGYDMTQYNISHYAELIAQLGASGSGQSRRDIFKVPSVCPNIVLQSVVTVPIVAPSTGIRHLKNVFNSTVCIDKPTMTIVLKSIKVFHVEQKSTAILDALLKSFFDSLTISQARVTITDAPIEIQQENQNDVEG